MSMIDDKSIRDAIHTSIAEKILIGLDSTHRDALLIESITKALTSYDFSREIEKVVSKKAAQIAGELVESEEWENKIRLAIKNGFSMSAALKKMFHGEDSQYGKCGQILGSWPKESK